MATTDSMNNNNMIYHQTIIPTQNITHILKGSFTLPNANGNEIVLIRFNRLELWKLYPRGGGGGGAAPGGQDPAYAECLHVRPLMTKVFDAVTVPTSTASSVASRHPSSPVEVEGARTNSVDYIAVSSETGMVQLLRYQLQEPPLPTRVQLPTAVEKRSSQGDGGAGTTLMVTTSLKGSFVKVSEVQLGRSGARVSVPGIKLTVDPQGEALFVTSLLRMKTVIPIERTAVDPSQLYGSLDDKEDTAGKRGREEEENEEEEDVNAEKDEEEEGPEGTRTIARAYNRSRKNNRRNIDRYSAQKQYFHKGVIKFGNPIDVLRNTVHYSVCAVEEEGVGAEHCRFAVLEEEIPDTTSPSPNNNNNNNSSSNEGGEGTKPPAGEAFLRLKNPTEGNTSSPKRVKTLVVYLYSFSLRQVTRSHTVVVPFTAHTLLSIPGGGVGPGGVLVCTDTEVLWYDLSHRQNISTNHTGLTGVFKCSTAFPRRSDFPQHSYDPSIVSAAVTTSRHSYFLLLQDEQGDLFRVDLERQEVAKAQAEILASKSTLPPPGGAVAAAPRVGNPLKVSYFDTIPVTTAMALFPMGLLFAASESAPEHTLYRILGNGYKTDSEYIVHKLKQNIKIEDSKPPHSLPARPSKGRSIALYVAHPKPKFLQGEQVFPNTPAIRSFLPLLGASGNRGEEEEEGQQVRFQVVGGRGADSTLQEAEYGYVVRTERRALLPTSFLKILPLPSAADLQRATGEQQRVLASAARLQQSNASHQEKLKTLHRLLAVAGQGRNIGVDKLILCTGEGSVTFSIGEKVEADTLSGFATAEETLDATTLQHGAGYIQVTRRCVHVLRATHPSAAASVQEDVTAVESSPSLPVVQPVIWTHPHGKPIAAASVTSRHALLSIGQGGGLISFHYGLTGTEFQPLDTLPTFPPSVAVSLLPHPSQHSTESQLQSLLFHRSASASLTDRAPPLAAVATVTHEVYLLDTSRLRDTLERVQCSSPIESILLTRLGSESGLQLLGERAPSQRLFCLVGHTDGMLTRIEIDPVTRKQMDMVEVSCGSAPCRVIPGDGSSMCYVQSGSRAWRCFLRRGVLKVVPWVFPRTPSSFARFVLPNLRIVAPSSSPSMKQEARDSHKEGAEDDFLSLNTTPLTQELVIAVRDRELAFFSVQQSSGETTSEYSLNAHRLPVAGRQILQHPTRRPYFIILGVEHRGYGREAVRRQQESGDRSIPYDAPGRSLGAADHYSSVLQLYHEPTHSLKPPYYLGEGEAALTMAVGSFTADFGKEPVVIVSIAPRYTHGAGCGGPARQGGPGVLRAFHFVSGALQHDGSQHLHLELVHGTTIKSSQPDHFDCASALHLCEDVGLLFVGLGKENGLRIYGWGKTQLLLKSHLSPIPDRIVDIKTVFSPPPPSARTTGVSFYANDLYRCPPSAESTRRATQCSLLVVCATAQQSIFVAALQAGEPSYLLQVAVDTVPRMLTSLAILDDRTYAASDRFGHVVFLRLQENHRLHFAEPLHRMLDSEAAAAESFIRQQPLQEVAVHHTGQVVTHLETLFFNPTHGADPSLNVRILFYGTATGAMGAYTPFVTEEEGALAAYLKPTLLEHVQRLLVAESGRLPASIASQGLTPVLSAAMAHHVLEGDLLLQLRQSTTDLYTTRSKAEVETELLEVGQREAKQRKVLGLPPRELPLLEDFIARQRALVTLPL